MAVQDFEKLGSFYLGKVYDAEQAHATDNLLLYDSKDLTTHAVCVGMTGSGKTGLCLALIEEAALDGIPAIVIDPKGDLGNLLLTFPDLGPADFRPWINEDDARKQGQDAEGYAAAQAALWATGLKQWGQDGARIKKLRDAADFAIYTPGSSAGTPISILRSFDPPPPEIVDDTELFRERIATTATSLLTLAGIEADPLQSREHILVSTLLTHAWSSGRSLDIGGIIRDIQSPPVARVGVMELETFYPAAERFALAMRLNNLIASPGFARWTEGQPLDVASLLYTPEGKARVAIVSIAHLADAERMFFVSLLVEQVLGWVRTQSGTASLRAILYMDEIAGYIPPVANPPSKGPFLTLMKQGRAFGLGVVLATQNPVDLDYKGLANAGTWLIGRLQTERDKQRVLDGLEGAAAAGGGRGRFDRAEMDRLLSGLTSRVFLLNNVHDNGPEVFQSRWCLSYLRGPLTRTQIKALTELRVGASPAPAAPAPPFGRQANTARPQPGTAKPRTAPAAATGSSTRPVLRPDVPQYFIPARSDDGTLHYEPALLGVAKVFFSDAKAKVEVERSVSILAAIRPGPVAVDWDEGEACDLTDADVEAEPGSAGATFAPLAPDAGKPRNYDAWKKALADSLYRTHKLDLMRCEAMKLTSMPDESERDFRARIAQRIREERDAASEKLRVRFGPRLATLQDRIRRAEQAVAVQREQASAAKMSTALSFGTAVLSAFLGRKVASAGNLSRAATAARGVGRSAKETADVGRAAENVEALQHQLADLEAQFQTELEAAAGRLDGATAELTTLTLKPKKTGIAVRAVMLAWSPTGADGARAW